MYSQIIVNFTTIFECGLLHVRDQIENSAVWTKNSNQLKQNNDTSFSQTKWFEETQYTLIEK